jgi:hypothetical protein
MFGTANIGLRTGPSRFSLSSPNEEREKRSRGWRISRFKTTPHPAGGHLPLPAKREED